MATAVASSLSLLLQQARLDDHEEILKAANNTLKKSKTDVNAQYIRVIALLKLDRYGEALKVLEEGGDALQTHACLEWAYTLYKEGQLGKAEAAAKGGDGARGLKHVEAQAVCQIRPAPGKGQDAYTMAGIPIGALRPCGRVIPGARKSEYSTR